MLHRLCGPPSIPLSFIVADVLPRWITYRFRLSTQPEGRTLSDHRLQRGLPGYLIPFAPHAFVPERQLCHRDLPSQSVFCVISMHFTATPRIPTSSYTLKPYSINGGYPVKLDAFTTNLQGRLRTL